MLQLLAWPLISVRYTVTTSPLARGSIRAVRDLGRTSPAKVDRATSSFQVPKGCPKQIAARSTTAGKSRRSGCAMNMAQHAPPWPTLQEKEGR